MTTARRRVLGKRDLYEPQIVDAFKAAGATVQQLAMPGVPDLLVGFLGQTRLVEVKTDDRQLDPLQKQWHDGWRGEPPVIVRNVPQAQKFIRMWTQEFSEGSRNEEVA